MMDYYSVEEEYNNSRFYWKLHHVAFNSMPWQNFQENSNLKNIHNIRNTDIILREKNGIKWRNIKKDVAETSFRRLLLRQKIGTKKH